QTATGVRKLAKQLGRATIHIRVGSILIVTKARDNSLVYLTRELTEWILGENPGIIVYVDAKLEHSKRFDALGIIAKNPQNYGSKLKYWTPQLTVSCPDAFDLVITLGGDGTVLYASGLFQGTVPPVIPFSLGSLGFLTNFPFEKYKLHLKRVFEHGINVNLRMRFTCTVYQADGTRTVRQQVLNELVIDRGPSPFISMLELYGDSHLLTIVQADGLILSTPTGSTAYSLSAGGSLVHPEIPAISVTPICPHTLSFRPMLLPDSMSLKVVVPKHSRAMAWVSFDGRNRVQLKSGDYVTVTASQYPFPTVVRKKTDYFDSVSRSLHWNVRQKQKPLSNNASDSKK
ncbi:ATP-NAD kinase, partial [Nadsonia fulvescens var. elongata DSM 6958]